MDEKEFIKELSNLLFIYRKTNNITLAKLSNLVGIESKFLNRLEHGKHDTLVSNYFKIAKNLNIPIEEISRIIALYFRQ